MTAILSDCGRYRYRLERAVGMFGPVVAVIMVNPSTADASRDDATIRRVIGFAKRHGWSRLIVGNVFALRSTDIRALASADDPVGPENASHLRGIFSESEFAIVGWGPLAKLPTGLRREWRNVCAIAGETGLGLKCLGRAKDGHPRHPLMLSYGSELTEWTPVS